jgi:hypothetical protein
MSVKYWDLKTSISNSHNEKHLWPSDDEKRSFTKHLINGIKSVKSM